MEKTLRVRPGEKFYAGGAEILVLSAGNGETRLLVLEPEPPVSDPEEAVYETVEK